MESNLLSFEEVLRCSTTKLQETCGSWAIKLSFHLTQPVSKEVGRWSLFKGKAFKGGLVGVDHVKEKRLSKIIEQLPPAYSGRIVKLL